MVERLMVTPGNVVIIFFLKVQYMQLSEQANVEDHGEVPGSKEVCSLRYPLSIICSSMRMWGGRGGCGMGLAS